MQLAVETRSLKKDFGEKVAVRDLTLQVPQGEVFGFLGPNGAGKTTAIKMLLGLVTPTAGDGSILGQPLGNVSMRSKIGFLPEHFRFHDWLTGEEFLQLHGDLYGMPKVEIQARSKELLERVKLFDHRKRLLRTYSKGMLQRVGLAQALLNHPQLVFLDEPTSGLDPVGRRLVRDIIRELREEGTTVFLNSHLLSEIEITCDTVAFIKNGEILQTNQLQTLIEGEMRVAIHVSNLRPEILSGLEKFGSNILVDSDTIRMAINNQEMLPQMVRYLVDQGTNIYTVTLQHQSLEDLFMQIIGADGGL